MSTTEWHAADGCLATRMRLVDSLSCYGMSKSDQLGVDLVDLRGRTRAPSIVRTREMLVTLGAGRFGLRVMDLAEALAKGAQAGSEYVTRGINRRRNDKTFCERFERLDRQLAEVGTSGRAERDNPGAWHVFHQTGAGPAPAAWPTPPGWRGRGRTASARWWRSRDCRSRHL